MATLTIAVAEEHTCSWATCRNGRDHRRHSLWKPPTYVGFQAPVPPPPDYSTPKKVTARCLEGAGNAAGRAWFTTAVTDRSFAKAMKDFRATVPKMKCTVQDTHRPKWEYRRIDGKYERRALRGRGPKNGEPIEVQ